MSRAGAPSVVWLDGRYRREDRARIAVSDPAVTHGIGLFEAVRAYGERCFRLEAHVERLRRSARHLGFRPRIPDLAPVIARLVRRNGLAGAYVRIVWTGGGHLLVRAGRSALPPRRAYREGARLAVAPWRRDPAAPLAGHKTLSYHELMLMRAIARGEGAEDALLLSPRGHVLEGCRSNVFAIQRGRLLTPPAVGILPGVTRQVVLELAREDRLPVSERPMTLRALTAADELFVTSSMMEILPVAQVGDRRIGRPGPVTRRLAARYREKVREETGR